MSKRDIIEMVEMDKMEGYIVKIYQEETFDRITGGINIYLMCYKCMVLKIIFRKWVNISYTDIYIYIYCSVKKTHHFTKYFPVRNSVKQWCPISALLTLKLSTFFFYVVTYHFHLLMVCMSPS
jgi:hypothetical protein